MKLTIEDLIAKNIVVLDNMSIEEQLQINNFIQYSINPEYQLLIQVIGTNDRFIPICIHVTIQNNGPKYVFVLDNDTYEDSFNMYTLFSIEVFKKTTVF